MKNLNLLFTLEEVVYEQEKQTMPAEKPAVCDSSLVENQILWPCNS